jgi:hypothetical protein
LQWALYGSAPDSAWDTISRPSSAATAAWSFRGWGLAGANLLGLTIGFMRIAPGVGADVRLMKLSMSHMTEIYPRVSNVDISDFS